ncbi:MAG: hypothetical protein FE040_00490 [Thermoplasmata archaeon]|nr:MAG: hypothetical protein FE040_00490 [Thermoplasmata archaeon]MCD6146620.1 hypothetical protein [Thermoplasmata archaeon]RLF62867.1 MAG: hypothetical protein DRN31_03575 [Thermoplasmata archaeon]HDH81932.1 hypothetical protein [Thermoplasmatales archaeon]
MKISVKDAETGSRISMDVESDNTIEEVVESAANYWNKDPGAYVVRFGKKVLSGQTTIKETMLQEGDVVELIPDPEGGKR